jgi:D-ribulokinase
MTEVVLGIDVGTSGVRIAARDREGRLRGMASAEMPQPVDGKHDAEVWWQALLAVFKQLDLTGLRVMALAIDGTSGTIVSVDDNGVPVAAASMYNDVASSADVALIKDVSPPETAAHGATSPLARALAMPLGSKILHQADWLMGRLSGRFDVTDENNALKTGYDPVARRWPRWIEETGMSLVRLPDVQPVGTRVGTILSDVARLTGLPADVVIVTGTTDGCAAFLASGADQAGDGVTSLGTTLTLKLLSSTPVFAPQYGIYSHRMGEQWLAGGASNSGGAVLKMFFSTDEIERLTHQIDPAERLDLDYYPLPKQGERFPINDPALQPRMTPRPKEDHYFLQALFEGMAGIEVLGYRRLAELGASTLRSIRTAGGGASNPVWTTLRRDALKVPEKLPASEHAAMGTARLAWLGIGHDA